MDVAGRIRDSSGTKAAGRDRPAGRPAGTTVTASSSGAAASTASRTACSICAELEPHPLNETRTVAPAPSSPASSISASRAESLPELPDHPSHPRLGRLGMDTVQREQVPNELVAEQAFDLGRVGQIEPPGEGLTVELGQAGHRRKGELADRAGRRLQLGQLLVEHGQPLAHRMVVEPGRRIRGPLGGRGRISHRWPRASGNAASLRSCRRPRTASWKPTLRIRRAPRIW